MSGPPRRPSQSRRRRDRERPGGNSGTALALIGLLAITGVLIGLGTMVLPQVFALPGVVFAFVFFAALHYLLWGWWLGGSPPDDREE